MDDRSRAGSGAAAAGGGGVSESYAIPEHGWTCFHCGETFTTVGAARDHFGFDPYECEPACRIKLGGERGLVMALRKAERAYLQAQEALHAESAEGLKALRVAEGRYRDQIVEAEQSGYDRGLSDGCRSCVQCGAKPLREILDGDPLCQACCNKWVAAERPDPA